MLSGLFEFLFSLLVWLSYIWERRRQGEGMQEEEGKGYMLLGVEGAFRSHELTVYRNWGWKLVGDLTTQSVGSGLGFKPPYHPDQGPERERERWINAWAGFLRTQGQEII